MQPGEMGSEDPPAVEELLAADPDVAFAVVFGSRADGTPGADSDLDVAVKFADGLTEQERFRKRCRFSGRLQRDDLPFVDLTDLDAVPLEIAHAAMNGEFLCGDEDAFQAFREQIHREYQQHKTEIEQRHRDTISRIAAGGLRG